MRLIYIKPLLLGKFKVMVLRDMTGPWQTWVIPHKKTEYHIVTLRQNVPKIAIDIRIGICYIYEVKWNIF